VIIRPVRLADAAGLTELMAQLGYPSDAAEMEQRLPPILGDDSYATLVAEVDGAVVGLIGLRVGRDYVRSGWYSQLLVLAVDEKARRGGIGRQLVEAAEAWARARGADVMVLHSGRQRTGAHAFYERVGYEATGVRFKKTLSHQGVKP
jgi:GNAT superfamily N-acetyltransferase